MAGNEEDFFKLAYDDEEVPERVERDRWDRPLIATPEGDVVPYTRMSTLSDYISNKSGLAIWQQRQIVRGMGLREDLGWMAGALPALTDDKRKDGPTSARLSEIAQEAMVAAGAEKKANWGTAVHGFTEPGMENAVVPAAMQADVRSYWDRIKETALIPIASEVFVVCDELEAAGTFDDLYWSWHYGLIVGDKKSGRQNMHATLIQLAGYANGKVYDPETGQRTSLQELLPDWLRDEAIRRIGRGENQQTMVNLDHALYVHIPKEQGVTEFYEADIRLGYEAAQHAAWVGKYNKRKDLVSDANDHLLEGVAAAQADAARFLVKCINRDQMMRVATEFKSVWTDELRAIGIEHLKTIGELPVTA